MTASHIYLLSVFYSTVDRTRLKDIQGNLLLIRDTNFPKCPHLPQNCWCIRSLKTLTFLAVYLLPHAIPTYSPSLRSPLKILRFFFNYFSKTKSLGILARPWLMRTLPPHGRWDKKRSGYPPIKKTHLPQATTLFDRPLGSKSMDPFFFLLCSYYNISCSVMSYSLRPHGL